MKLIDISGNPLYCLYPYVKYFGKPVYKFCRRRLRFNQYFSLAFSHILGALFHAGGMFIVSFYMWLLIILGSMVIFSLCLYFTHKSNIKKRP